jgi:hypothetical protein
MLVKAGHPLYDASLKLRWASKELQALDRDIGDYFKRDPYAIEVEHDGDTGEEVVYCDVTEPVDEDWAIRLGVIATEWRGALDYTVHELAGRPVGGRRQFPIFKDEWEYRQPRGKRKVSFRDSMLKDVPDPHCTVIDRLQPYHRPDPSSDPLAMLDWLTGCHKHKALRPALLGIEGWPMLFGPGGVTDSVFEYQLAVGNFKQPLVGRTEAYRMRVIENSANVKVEPGLATHVAFSERDFPDGAPVLHRDDLFRIRGAVAHAVERFVRVWQ